MHQHKNIARRISVWDYMHMAISTSVVRIPTMHFAHLYVEFPKCNSLGKEAQNVTSDERFLFSDTLEIIWYQI